MVGFTLPSWYGRPYFYAYHIYLFHRSAGLARTSASLLGYMSVFVDTCRYLIV